MITGQPDHPAPPNRDTSRGVTALRVIMYGLSVAGLVVAVLVLLAASVPCENTGPGGCNPGIAVVSVLAGETLLVLGAVSARRGHARYAVGALVAAVIAFFPIYRGFL